MAKIDTHKWQQFIIGDLFEKLQLDIKNENFNKMLDVSEERTDEFNLPLVNAKHGNNGIMYYGRETDFDIAEMAIDIVQNGAIATGDVYAQPQKTGVLWDAYLVKPKADITSPLVLLFLATVLEKAIKDKFSYDDKCIWDKAKLLPVMLPCTVNGEPDWAYMDSYMSEVMRGTESDLEALQQADGEKHALNIARWQRFHLYDDNLFDIDMGTKLDRVKMTQVSPDVNFVGRANTNNGITARVDSVAGITPYDAGNMTLSLGGEYLGSCFIQPDRFYTSQNVVVLIPKWDMPPSVKQFISTMIFRESRQYYKAFIDELNRHIKTDFSFYLPVNTDGEPDWAYMEVYMSEVMQEAENSFDALQQAHTWAGVHSYNLEKGTQ